MICYLNKVDFIIYEIFKYLDYKTLLKIQLLNNHFYNICKQYENYTSERYINRLNRMLELEKDLKHQIKNFFPQFPLSHFKLHLHNVLLDIGHNIFSNGFEIMVIADFSYFHKNRYHRIKLVEDFTDDRSYNGEEEKLKVCYSVPGFDYLFLESIYIGRFKFDENNNKYSNSEFNLLPKLMGFDIQNFKDMFYFIWGKYEEDYNIYDESNMTIGFNYNFEILNNMITQKIDTSKKMGLNMDLKNYKDKCEIWLYNLEESFDFKKEIEIFNYGHVYEN